MSLFSPSLPYVVTVPPGRFDGSDIVVGILETPLAEGRIRLRYCCSNPQAAGGRGAHRLDVVEVSSTEDRVLVRDVDSAGPDPMLWRFDRLTHKLWTRMGQTGWVPGFTRLQPRLTDDSLLQQYYAAQIPDWWEKESAAE